MLLVGLAALLVVGVSASDDAGMFGEQTVDCGTAVVSDTEAYGGAPLAACMDALGTRRAWGWPVLIVGGVVVTGALLVRAPARDDKTA